MPALFLTLWSILTSRIGQIVIAAVVAFTIGYGQANRRADIERLNAEVVTAKSDQTTAENARVLADSQMADLDKQREANERRIEDLQAELEKNKNHKPDVKVVTKTVKVPVPVSRDCGLSEDQLRRLKEIR